MQSCLTIYVHGSQSNMGGEMYSITAAAELEAWVSCSLCQ